MDSELNTVELATELTIAWLGNHNTRTSAEDVPAFLKSMYDAVSRLAGPTAAAPAPEPVVEEYAPAVTARKSLASPDHIVSMIDGKPYKTLRRHLSSNGVTPEQYRERYKLKADYPMVAATYSEARRAMAKAIGLGRKAGIKIEDVEQKVEKAMEPVTKAARKGSKAALAAAKEALGTAQ
ncbi:MAG: MucR family transcriptional regulator [Janthinobacterium lividum]